MSIFRRLAAGASVTACVALMPLVAAQATPTAAAIPDQAAAGSAAGWLASQVNAQGFVPSAPGATTASYSSTAQVALALASAGVDLDLARSSVAYLENHVDAYVQTAGVDGPAQLSLLILDAHALRLDPRNFGGTDLVARLLATQQTTGPDAGLFGTETQAANYAAGGYQQGLALAALAAAGVQGTPQTTAGVSWLTSEQCPDGGWTTPDNANNPCNGTPASYQGPDTNATSLAVQGLVAQGASSSQVSSAALAFLSTAQDGDGGWSYYPNTTVTPGSTDPDSTALVIQALIALGQSPAAATYAQSGGNPLSALLSFQLTSGSANGAFDFTSPPASGNLIATYQAVPALEGLTVPWVAPSRGYWEVAKDGGLFAFGDANFYGSMGGKPLTQPVVGIAATPDGHGYWEVASDGGLFAFGDANFYGSMGGKPLTQPVVGIAATPDGHGYWEVAKDGGLFAFGDANFYGSMGGKPLTQPVVGIAATPDGHGYWEVASDGGLFAFGDANFYGSMGGKPLTQPVVGIAATPDGHGYWEVAKDGGLFAFGDANFYGSMGGKPLTQPVVGIAATPDGHGYWEVASDGGLFAFGDANFYGSMGGKPLTQPVVGIAP